MTPLQSKIHAFIRDYLADHEYSPSLAEIAEAVGLSAKSVSLVSRNIHALVAQGNLVFDKKGYRNIRLGAEEQGSRLPFLGRIAAGVPIEAVEDSQFIDFGSLFQTGDRFILQVKGHSMRDEGILDGDYVICDQGKQAREGDIVVALIDKQEATLKRISYRVPDRVTLIPANPDFKPTAYVPQRVQVQGIYAGLLRLHRAMKSS